MSFGCKLSVIWSKIQVGSFIVSNLISTDSEIKNEIYNFVKNNISDPGSEAEKENWVGYKDLSLGNLVIMYSKINIRDEIFEILEITNPQMMDYTTGEEVIEVMG